MIVLSNIVSLNNHGFVCKSIFNELIKESALLAFIEYKQKEINSCYHRFALYCYQKRDQLFCIAS